MMSKDNPKPQESIHTLDDAFPMSRMEAQLETLIEQNDEILTLLKAFKVIAMNQVGKEKK